MKFFQKLERKFGRYAIHNLMYYIMILYAIDNLSNAGMVSRVIYVVFAVAAMLSSSVAFIFTVCNRFNKPVGKLLHTQSEMAVKLVIAIVFILICTFGSSFGLLNIIRYGYGTFTTIVGPVMLVPLIVSVPYRLWKDRKDGILNEHYDLKEKVAE